MLTPEQRGYVRAYILDNSIPEPNTGCWIWLKSWSGRKDAPRAQWMRFGENLAYRLSYAAFVGDPGASRLLHSCDCGVCVNPEHVAPGTQQENMRQCRDRGRLVLKRFYGPDHWNAKLSPEQVTAIRAREHVYGVGAALAREFGVTESTISAIRRGLSRGRG